MLAIRLPKEIEARLTELAAKTGRTKSFYVREAILEHLDEMEDKYLAIERLENPGKRWTLDELEQGLDLDR
ncbi:MAG: TraY domain-containing protein [Candidatus Competibacteraceae bacterium]|nr:TraY domain-containing protein [Candidatus Competibacteraceae bacterium]